MSNIQTYYMDRQSTFNINEIVKRLGMNFIPSPRANAEHITFQGPQGLDKCVGFAVALDLHTRQPNRDGTPVPGRDVLINFTMFDEKQHPKSIIEETMFNPALQEILEAVAVPGAEGKTTVQAFNKVKIGAFTRYGVSEVLAFNDLKNQLLETGFYINLEPGIDNE